MSLWQLILCCAVHFLSHFFIGVGGLQWQPDEVLEQQERQFLEVSQVSTFLLSDRPSFITKSCDFLTCALAVDGEERVGGGGVERRRLRTCEQVVNRDLRRPGHLELLQFRLVVLLVVVLLH